MADGTRFKMMEENFRRTDAQIAEMQQFMAESREFQQKFQQETCQKFDAIDKNAEDQKRMLENLTEMVRSYFSKGPGVEQEVMQAGSSRTRVHSIGDGLLGRQPIQRPPELVNESGDQNLAGSNEFRPNSNRLPKIDFPNFDGANPRSWIRRCERYFTIFQTPEPQKFELASMYVTGKADAWLQGAMLQSPFASWNALKIAILVRFGELQGTDIIGEFNKLQQKDDLETYNEKFEELRAGMLIHNPHLPESYFVASYISGLREEFGPLVCLGEPTSMAKVLEIANAHNRALKAIVSATSLPGSLSALRLEL